MIEAIDDMCVAWGMQEIGKRTDENQGWPGQSTIARARDSQFDPTKPLPLLRKKKRTALGKDCFAPRPVQFTEEAHTGDGLVVAMALKTAPEPLQAIAYAHYAVTMHTAKQKAKTLGVSVPEYWRYLDRLHYWLAARIWQPDVPIALSQQTR